MSRTSVTLVLLLLALAGCRPGSAPASRELLELERLAYVPSQIYFLEPFAVFRMGPRWNLSVTTSVVLDRYEVTRGDLAYYRDTGRWAGYGAWAERALAIDPQFFEPDRLDWPAFLSKEEAVELAALRGMRLPTVTEWIHVAVGRSDRKYPWGRDQSSVANTLETGLGQPTRVGTFESGRDLAFGCYDLVGNVWEWVEGGAGGYVDLEGAQLSDRFELTPVRLDPLRRAWAMGGAFDTARQQTYTWSALDQDYRFHIICRDRDTIAASLGARMAADAGAYLLEQGGRWGTGGEVRQRVRSVGRRWASDPEARADLERLLRPLVEGGDAPEALGWLLEGVQAPLADLGGTG